MKPTLSLFWTFVKRLAKEWIFWISLALDIIAAVIQLFLPSITIPRFAYIVIIIIGLVWASFRIYLDLIERIPGESRPLQPNLTISCIEGDEYYYKIVVPSGDLSLETLKSYEFSPQELKNFSDLLNGAITLPKSIFTLKIRIENSGLVDINILNISMETEMYQPYMFLGSAIRNLNDTPVIFPINLISKEILQYKFIATILPYTALSDAQIAA
jgi:hypothetical protein